MCITAQEKSPHQLKTRKEMVWRRLSPRQHSPAHLQPPKPLRRPPLGYRAISCSRLHSTILGLQVFPWVVGFCRCILRPSQHQSRTPFIPTPISLPQRTSAGPTRSSRRCPGNKEGPHVARGWHAMAECKVYVKTVTIVVMPYVFFL